MSFIGFAGIIWGLTVGVTFLFLAERLRGVRYLVSVRVLLDKIILVSCESWRTQVPTLNPRFLRQLFHYLIHKILSTVLRFLEWNQKTIKGILRFNKKKAVILSAPNPDSHLQKVAAHKEESALNSAEKKARKAAALRGDV